MNTIRSNMQAVFWAVLSGVMLTAAFPKSELSWIAWIALIPLLSVIKDKSAGQGFSLGLITGCVHYLTLIYWLAGTMKTYGQLPWYVCLPVLFLFAFFLSLYTAGFAALTVRCCRHPIVFGILLPVIWVALEYVRSFFLTGFPWELIGYSQFRALRIIQISDIFGVYGVSYLITFGNAALFIAVQTIGGGIWQGKRFRFHHGLWIGGGFIAVFCLAWWYGEKRLNDVERLEASASTEKMAVIQGNVSQSIKWDPAFRLKTTEKHIALSKSTASQKPALIIWPETATPFFFMAENRYTPMLISAIRSLKTDVVFGSPAFERNNESISYRNRAYLMTTGGRLGGQYDKAHLVPFGEYIPLKKWLPFAGKIVASVGDFEPGPKGKTIPWRTYQLGMQICYEMIFPGPSRAMAENGANCIINITNDAWYGTSSAPYQLFSMAVFRAVENRRAVIRAANTGISGFISPTGRIITTTALFEDAAVTRTIPMLSQLSIYTRWGDGFAMLCLIITGLLLLGVLVGPKRKTK